MSIIKILKKSIVNLYQEAKTQTQLRKNFAKSLDSYTITNFLSLDYDIKVSIGRVYRLIKN